jgi:hypothetical protein
MGFWFAFFLLVATTVVSALMQKHPKDAVAAGAGEFTVPTAEAGRPIPVAYGTVKLQGPNVTWWGDLVVQALTQKSGGFLGIGAKKVATGYQYFAGMMLALCHGPVDSIVQIQVGDVEVDPHMTQTPIGIDRISVAINNPELFGGNNREGGIAGTVSFYKGLTTQLSNAYLTSKLGRTSPAYHGLCYAVLERVYLGTSQYLKNWAFVVKRCPNTLGLTGGQEAIRCQPSSYSNLSVGNGTMTGLSLGYLSFTDIVTVKATDATHFNVTSQSGAWFGAAVATVGVAYSGYGVAFTINAGTIPFAAGDTFFIQSDGNYDANPACVVYDLMTSVTYGLGLPPSRFDIASFQTAGNTLYTEGFGVSFLMDRSTTADNILSDMARTCDFVLYTDPATGLWTMRLVRADYSPASLVEYTIDDMLEAPRFTRGSWSETVNEVKVEYISRVQNFSTQIAQAQEPANYAVRQELVSETFSYHSISNNAMAQWIASREVKTHSYPLAHFTVKLNRKGWSLRPGSVFKLTWAPPSGPTFTGLVVRVLAIRYGDMGNPGIEVDVCEDIFSIANTAYTTDAPTGWVPPIDLPAQASAQFLFEAPYHLVGEERWCVAVAARGDLTSYQAEVWVNESAGYFRSTLMTNITPSGSLLNAFNARNAMDDGVGFTIASGGVDMSRLVAETTNSAGRSSGNNLALFQDTGEIVAWTTCTDNLDGTFTFSGVLRGVLDTVPADHASSVRVWFFSEGCCTTKDTAYPVATLVYAKMLPMNWKGTAPIAGATEVTLNMPGRPFAPNPPGNVKMNNLGYANWPTSTLSDAVLSWSHRNRITQGVNGAMVSQDTAGTYTIEGTITVEVYVGGVLKQTYSGLTGTSQTYTALQRIADDTDGTKAVTMKIKPIDGTYTYFGTVRTTPPFTMSGFGMTFGNLFGGSQA